MSGGRPVVGVDFDNTIVCYDEVFHREALERGLVPADLAVAKRAVRDYLRAVGRETEWTELQGRVYGSMAGALPYPGVLDFLASCRHARVKVFVISHKTRFPFRGPRLDLHRAAFEWMEQMGFFDRFGAGVPREHVFFEPTKDAKLRRLRAQRCTHFVDDLPEFLAEGAFPPEVTRILFDPAGTGQGNGWHLRVAGWGSLASHLLAEGAAP